MKKILSFLVVAALVVSCSKTDEVQPSSYIITGHNTTASTRLYTADLSDLPFGKSYSFWWSDGDKIWVGSQQQPSDPLTESSNYGYFAEFALPRVPQSGDQVIYNMMANTSAEASIAVVPAEQDASKSLGLNGAFGRADLDKYNSVYSFTLENKTNFVTFNIKALPSGATLKSIRLDAGNAIVAGSAAWSSNDGWGEVSNGSSTINLKVNKSSVSADEYITMVILPPADMTIPSAKITYELEISGATKYYTQTLGSKTFQTGEMARVSVDLSEVELYELRTLTFEGEPWTALIPDSEYGNGNGQYDWDDEGNTALSFTRNPNALFPGYGGHAISKYVGSDWETDGNYSHDLQAYNVTGGANGSENFCVHFGYLDDSGYGMMNELVGIEFGDNKAHVIESMYVTNTTYVYNQLQAAGFGSTYVLSDESTFKIVAYGYDDVDAEDDEYVSSSEFYLLNTGKNFVTNWTKWNLSGLGKVAAVRFNLVGSDDMVGDYGLAVPGYFAYDDVTVRF
ncbi:MAG: DUF4465 domain-containing protein [Alistipes sp.]|nr:DUF4465 domain-containing protein [Alistipes sp.]